MSISFLKLCLFFSILPIWKEGALIYVGAVFLQVSCIWCTPLSSGFEKRKVLFLRHLTSTICYIESSRYLFWGSSHLYLRGRPLERRRLAEKLLTTFFPSGSQTVDFSCSIFDGFYRNWRWDYDFLSANILDLTPRLCEKKSVPCLPTPLSPRKRLSRIRIFLGTCTLFFWKDYFSPL